MDTTDPAPADQTELRDFVEVFGPLGPPVLFEFPLSCSTRINFVANMFTRSIYADIGAQSGLGRPEFVSLLLISRSPGAQARDVARASGLPKNSISRAVTDLQRQGLIRRRRMVEDRRGYSLELTEAGKTLLPDLLAIVEDRQAALLSVLGQDERASLDRIMRKLVLGAAHWVNETRE